MTQDELQSLDDIFKARKTDYESTKTVAKLVLGIMWARKPSLVQSLYDYIMDGYRARNLNVLEFFGQKQTLSVSHTIFYCASDMFERYYHTEKSKALSALCRTIKKEAEADYAEAYRLYCGNGGARANLKAAAKKCVAAICKNPTAPFPRILLAHLISNDENGLVIIKSAAAWILNGIEIKNSKTALEIRSNAIQLAKSLQPRCYIIDENLIENKTFMTAGTPACKIDYMGEEITATMMHRSPTPDFFYHLANDFSKMEKASPRGLDACTLYDLAHFMDPKLPVPAEYTMEKRAVYLAEYRKEFNAFLGEMNALVEQMEEAERKAKEYRAQEQAKRDAAIRETIEIISEVQAKKDAERIQNEIEMELYARGFFGQRK